MRRSLVGRYVTSLRRTHFALRAGWFVREKSSEVAAGSTDVLSKKKKRVGKRLAHVPDFHSFVATHREKQIQELIEAARAHAGELKTRHGEHCVDGFGRRHSYLRLSLTERCNLRCRYCMPAEGVSLQSPDLMLSGHEIVKIARQFNRLGVDKIRLTGGEPLVSKELDLICDEIGSFRNLKSLAITTNALTLSRKLPSLVAKGKI